MRQRKQGRAEERRRAREASHGKDDAHDVSTSISGRGLLPSLISYTHPRSVTPRMQALEQHEKEAVQSVAQMADVLTKQATLAAADGATVFLVHGRADDENALVPAFFVPSEILVEVVNPKPDCRYSVSIVSEGRYMGSAQLLSPEQPLEVGGGPGSAIEGPFVEAHAPRKI